MQITRIEGFKDSLKAAVDLPVSSSGMNITVGSAFFVLGSSYSLTEDFTATLTADPANETWYTLYLAIENSTGGVVVFMDDIVKDGAEEVYSWKGGPFTREGAPAPRFKPGQKVRTRNVHPEGHTRLPRYARAKVGVIAREHGAHVFPDSNAHFRGEAPQHLYSVRIEARELWGEAAGGRGAVYLDLWDSYLDPL
ncbi:MAG: nitrile hydratase subunit beta [SAR324 cluster bacterium]|nr:nitrile hydratase subunit beta [SAR324 cluster bacterium]